MPDPNPYQSPSIDEDKRCAQDESPVLNFARGCAIVFLFLLTLPAAAIAGFTACIASVTVLNGWLGWNWSIAQGFSLGFVVSFITLPVAMYLVARFISRWD